ncbi:MULTISPECIES: hypothetical protein [Pseudomonas]|uniref:Uncharacterized protein n=1 Tax=Pseudomonas mosselii TaxID=78327 RepID=A0A5R8YV84_9PSED|nr:hypothetical protein [Pseudomonas mosselii]TLP57281.1 hypothetical protein FEM01_16845 [Pseudomonas mosselii]
MQIYLNCPDCIDEQARHEKSSEKPDCPGTKKRLSTYPVQLTNEVSYEVKCVFGHSSAVSINMSKHDILFEIGVHSIIDGYYREAITSFAASLERFYEFASRAIALHYGLPEKEEGSCWKEISTQSERQLGAYIYLYAIHFKGRPRILTQSQVKLRNSSVHKGHIPTRDEAISFGEEVLLIISEAALEIGKTISDSAHKVLSRQAEVSVKKITDSGGVQSRHASCVDSAVLNKTYHGRSLVEHLKIAALRHSRSMVDKHSKIIVEFESSR